MTRWLALALAATLAACGIGAGSAYVGQWRPHSEPVFDACLVDATGRCVDQKRVVAEIAARRFWGVIITLPAIGAASVSHDGMRSTRFRAEPSLEILRGRGRWALGVRTGALIDANRAGAMSIVGLGHLSLTDRLSVHAGAGPIPYARIDGENSFLGVRAVTGLQLALSRTRSENFIVLSLDADTSWIDFSSSYLSTGLTGHLGIFF